MSETRQHIPADVRERVKGAWATVEAAALAQADLLDSHYGGQRAKAAEIRNAVEQVSALLRTPRGEGEAMDADAMWYHWSSGHEAAALQGLRTATDDEAHRFLDMLARWQKCPKPSDHDAIAALRSDPPGATSGEGEADAESGGDVTVSQLLAVLDEYNSEVFCMTPENADGTPMFSVAVARGESAERLKQWASEDAEEPAALRSEEPVGVLDTLRELICDVAASGVALDDPRLRYVEIQIDRQTWDRVCALAARQQGGGE